MSIPTPSGSAEEHESGERIFQSSYYGEVHASEVILDHLGKKPGTFGRFIVVTCKPTKSKWPTIFADYVDGIVDEKGNWIADFPEPTKDNPTKF